jgi:peptidoglycan glycosyltransferase
VVLTIDAQLCEIARDALDGANGAVVVMNYETGEILASVSSPSFDPADMSDFAEGGGESELVNRAFSGLYPPGSTFKLITAAALIENGLDGFETTCDGGTTIDGEWISCTDEHGREDLEDALRHSCNAYFAQAVKELGASALRQQAEKFLFNKETLFDDVIMADSVFETSASDADNAWAAIGQYHDLITPLHACMIAACIANDGVMMEPKLLYSLQDGDDEKVMLKPTVAATPMSDTSRLKEMMISVVESGTGTRAQIDGVTVAGKTGTAEVDTGDEEGGEHAWFVGFIDDSDHPLAIAVIVEMAGSGGKNAAPAAREVLKEALDLGY